jgi:hypothetical protein
MTDTKKFWRDTVEILKSSDEHPIVQWTAELELSRFAPFPETPSFGMKKKRPAKTTRPKKAWLPQR